MVMFNILENNQGLPYELSLISLTCNSLLFQGTVFIGISQKEETETLRLYCEIDCPTPRRVAKDRLSKRSLENPEWSSSISADSSNGLLEWPVHARVKRGSSGRGISLEEGRIKTNGLDNFGQR